MRTLKQTSRHHLQLLFALNSIYFLFPLVPPFKTTLSFFQIFLILSYYWFFDMSL